MIVLLESEAIAVVVHFQLIVVLLVDDLFEMVIVVPENIEFNFGLVLGQVEDLDSFESLLNRGC